MDLKNIPNKKEQNLQNQNQQKEFNKFKINLQDEKILKDKPYLAAFREDLKGLKALVENGQDINQQDLLGYTALLIAILKDNFEIVKYLIEQGADINICNKWGDSPLTLAVELNSIEIVKYLIEKGADPTIRNFFGYDALDYAKINNNSQMIELLNDYLEKYQKEK